MLIGVFCKSPSNKFIVIFELTGDLKQEFSLIFCTEKKRGGEINQKAIFFAP